MFPTRIRGIPSFSPEISDFKDFGRTLESDLSQTFLICGYYLPAQCCAFTLVHVIEKDLKCFVCEKWHFLNSIKISQIGIFKIGSDISFLSVYPIQWLSFSLSIELKNTFLGTPVFLLLLGDSTATFAHFSTQHQKSYINNQRVRFSISTSFIMQLYKT